MIYLSEASRSNLGVTHAESGYSILWHVILYLG
jgi:hypothetical protein